MTREQLEAREAADLAPYGLRSRASRGRAFQPDPEPDDRTAFQRDRDRILHTTAFRRLEYKTQVFVNFEGDYYRTRLTHTLEVAQIGRTVARSLGANEDLVEAICLSHDLGHPPFGHSGEVALNRLMRRLRRLRPQQAVAAYRHRARAPLPRMAGPQPDLGSARGHRQARDRVRHLRRRRLRTPTSAATWKRKSATPLTSWPTPPTTWTTACAPACWTCPTSPALACGTACAPASAGTAKRSTSSPGTGSSAG